MSSANVVRKGESRLTRILIEVLPPVMYIALSSALALSLLRFLDNAQFNSGEHVKWYDIFAGNSSLRVGDVTTIISATLVLIRITGQAFVLSTAWRCTMTSLQHGGLTLSQLNTMVSYRIPTSLAGEYSVPIGIALLMTLPSIVIAPILSGSVDWETAIIAGTLPAGFNSSLSHKDAEYWARFEKRELSVYWEVIQAGLGPSAILWGDKKRQDRETQVGHQYRYIPQKEGVVGTTLEDVPLPYIRVENITWVEKFREPKKGFLFWGREYYHIDSVVKKIPLVPGITWMFRKDQHPKYLHRGEPDSVYENHQWGISVLVGGTTAYANQLGTPPLDYNCEEHGWATWPVNPLQRTPLIPIIIGRDNDTVCVAVGNMTLTAGFKTFPKAKYVTNWTVEATELLQTGELPSKTRPTGDPWGEATVLFLNDMIRFWGLTRSTTLTGGDVTSYTEEIIRQAYIAMRHAFPLESEVEQRLLTTHSPSQLLEAKVDRFRVWLWPRLSMLLPASWLLIVAIEKASGKCRRGPAINTSLIPLLTDVREVLVQDVNRLSNMSFLTREDTALSAKFRLGLISTGPKGPEVYGLQRVQG